MSVEGIPQRPMSSAQSAMSSPSSVSLVSAILDEVLAAVVATSRNLDDAESSNSEVAALVDGIGIGIVEVESPRPTTSRLRAGQTFPSIYDVITIVILTEHMCNE